LGDTTKIATLINDQFDITTGTSADDLTVLVVESSDDTGEFGVYHWTPTSQTDKVVAQAELTILGIYSGDAIDASTDLLIH